MTKRKNIQKIIENWYNDDSVNELEIYLDDSYDYELEVQTLRAFIRKRKFKVKTKKEDFLLKITKTESSDSTGTFACYDAS